MWDPIGILEKGEVWDHQTFADEYDTYLMKAAGMLRQKSPLVDVENYLIQIESEHMGLGKHPFQRRRIRKVIDAIQNDNELWLE